jgi:hypothetical protein
MSLTSHMQLEDRLSDLRYLIEPAVIAGDIPLGVASPAEFVSKVDDRKEVDVSAPLVDVARAFLDSRGRTLALLGEPGSGKSMFVWRLGQQLYEASPLRVVDTPVSRLDAITTPFLLPVYIELKHNKVSELGGLLDRTLTKCGLSEPVIQALRTQDPAHPMVRLVVLADGFDELQGDPSSVRDFVGLMCGGPPWAPELLAVIVTSRENRLGSRGIENDIFCEHQRAVLLPFSTSRVSDGCVFFHPYSDAFNHLRESAEC